MLELDIFAPVRTRITCQLNMPQLTIDEAKEFIAYRLGITKAGKALFDPDAVECLAVDSKGNRNRRVLISLAAMCLEVAARRNDKVATAEIVNVISSNFTF